MTKQAQTNRKPRAMDKWLGLRIRQRRRELNMTQAQLAERIGVTFQQVQKYESGANRITVSRLYDIAGALHAHVTWFLGEHIAAASPLAMRITAASARDAEFIDTYLALPGPLRDAIRNMTSAIASEGGRGG